MKNFFFSTVYNSNLYKLIIDQCLREAKLDKKKIIIKQIKIKKLPSFNFLFFCMICFLKGDFFSKEKVLNINYKNVYFGIHAISKTYRSFKSYESNLIFFFNLFKNIYIAGKLINTADYILSNYKFKYAYIDHLEYLNGIIYQKFILNNKTVYSNRYPKNILRCTNKNISKIFKLNFRGNKIKKNDLTKTKKKIKQTFSALENYLPWMKRVEYDKFKLKSLKKYQYIIYAHSFTDSQLTYGYDGFANVYDWLKFTVDILEKKKVNFIIKSHPNFYLSSKGKTFNEIYFWDNKIFSNYISSLAKKKNILILNQPFNNKDVVKLLDKKCIVVTKHGTIQLEMAHHNFKIIASEQNIFDKKYKLVNSWNSKEQYIKLLNTDWSKLKYANKKNTLIAFKDMFLNDDTPYGKNFYLRMLKNEMVKKGILSKNTTFENVVLKFNKLKQIKYFLDKIRVPILRA